MPSPHIAIIGAGPGGLMLACLLQHNEIQCTIYELDQDRHVRDQGGIVDLHPQSGQLALREAGLFEDFQKYSLPEAEAMKLIKSDATICWDENKTKTVETRQSRERPEIDRKVLRDILLDSIPSDFIQWNKKLVCINPSERFSDKYNIHFTDSVEKDFDLIIGADGAWSKVRSQLTDQRPYYSGITVVELKANEVSSKKK